MSQSLHLNSKKSEKSPDFALKNKQISIKKTSSTTQSNSL